MAEPGHRYLVHVRTEGNECRKALIFVTNRANRAGKLIFRQAADPIDRANDLPIFPDEQVLIHEVNPESEEKETPESATEERNDPPNPA